ncbi:hypothetical protein TNCV_4821401 [Trichonephila clavipes]|nr:hypothetical protein TNCV_4821401 [Trichonephila clavipes]
MEIPLPNTPQASRPGTPEDFGPTFENCRKFQELTTLIDPYSSTLENTHTLLKGLMQSGLKDPNNPIIVKEKSYMELTNERLQQALTKPLLSNQEASHSACSTNHSARADSPSTRLLPLAAGLRPSSIIR